jgi:hypothetical protein
MSAFACVFRKAAGPESANSVHRVILLGHTKIENTVRYLGVDIEDALALAESTEI